MKPSIIESSHISSAQWPYVTPEVDGTDKPGLTKITVLGDACARHCGVAYVVFISFNLNTVEFRTAYYKPGLPWWLRGKESACCAGAAEVTSLIPGSRISPGGGLGNPLQYSCPENAMDRGAW